MPGHLHHRSPAPPQAIDERDREAYNNHNRSNNQSNNRSNNHQSIHLPTHHASSHHSQHLPSTDQSSPLKQLHDQEPITYSYAYGHPLGSPSDERSINQYNDDVVR